MSFALSALLAAGLMAPSAAASSGARPLVVLVDSSTSMAPDLRSALVKALETQVHRSAQYKWVEPPMISIDELALALNCGGMDDACLRKAGESLRADSVLLATVSKNAGRSEVILSIVHIRPARPTKLSTVPLQDLLTTVDGVGRAARSLLGPVKPTRLEVLTEPAGANVAVDGRPSGHTPLTVNDLPEGKHTVAVSLAGHDAQSVDVALAVGESTEVRLTLSPAAAAPAPAAPTPTAAATPPAPAARREPSPVATTEPSPLAKLRWPLVTVGAVGGGLGGLVGVGGLLATLGGIGAWLTYFGMVAVQSDRDLALSLGATQKNATMVGVLTYALFFPGLIVLAIGAVGLGIGVLVAGVPFFLLGE